MLISYATDFRFYLAKAFDLVILPAPPKRATTFNFLHFVSILFQIFNFQYFEKNKKLIFFLLSCIIKLLKTSLGPALPLGQLDHCLRPPSGKGPQIFEKEVVEIKKKKNQFQMKLQKILYILVTKEQKIQNIFVNIGTPKFFLV